MSDTGNTSEKQIKHSAWQKMSYGELRDFAEQSEARVRELEQALLDIEWCGLSDYCLLCGRTKSEGHNSICRIAAALHVTDKAVKNV